MPFTQNDDSNNTETDNALAALVGDDKKFKTVDDLAKGKMEADIFITELQNETAQYRQLLESNTARDQKLDQLFELLTKRPEQSNVQGAHQTAQETTVTSEQSKQETLFSSKEDLDSYVNDLLKGREMSTRAEKNLNEVQAKLTEKYSDKSATFIKKRSDELGITVDDMKSMAERSPAAFYRMMDMDSQPRSSLSFNDTISSAETNTKESDGSVRNREWWNTQRREKGKRWFLRPENQKAYFSDYQSLGSKF